MRKKYDWNALKEEYITGDITARSLAEKYNIPFPTLDSHYKKEKWEDEKQKSAITLTTEIEIADKLAEALSEAVNDKEQFYRYIVKEKEGTNVSEEERIFRKMDMQALNNAIKALSSLEEIKLAMQGALFKEDKSEDSHENETGVVILPEIVEGE